jgi:hypothetical protein
MKKCIIILVLLLNSISILAQETKDASDDRQGNKAISFGFDQFSASEYFLGIGGRYWAKNDLVYFGSIDYSLSNSKDEGSEGYTSSSFKENSIQFSVGFEHHLPFKKNKDVSPFIGGDFFISKSEYSINYSVPDKSPPEKSKRIDDTKGFSIFFGVEYFINESISFSLHYALKYSNSKYTYTDVYNGTTDNQSGESNSTYFAVSPLILSVYF